jgi:hypothetical protein
MSEIKLLPCPFCGENPTKEVSYQIGCAESEETVKIFCLNPDCPINPSTGEIPSFKWIEGKGNDPHRYERIDKGERAIKAWNTRPTQDTKEEIPVWKTFACRSCAKLLDCIRDYVRPDDGLPCYTAIKGMEGVANTQDTKAGCICPDNTFSSSCPVHGPEYFGTGKVEPEK